MSTQTLDPSTTNAPSIGTDVDIAPYEDTHDPNTRTHLVRPADNGVTEADDPMTGKDIVDLGRLTGTEVVALCGYTWIPKANPDKYDSCTACFEIAGQIMRGERP